MKSLSIMKKEERIEYGYKCAAYMLLATFLLAILKFFVGWLTNSLVITTDAMHSLTDVIVLLTALVGLKFAKRGPTEKFPYGYYKAESLSSFLISLMIVAISINFFYEGYKRIFEFRKLDMPILAILTTLFSIISSYLMAIYISKVANKIKMQSLIATSNERKMDSISSMAVMITLFLDIYKISYAEGIVTIGIAGLIFRTGILSLKDSIASLMDVSPLDIEEQVKKIFEGKKIKHKDLRLRKAGPFIFGEAKILVNGKMNVDRAHEIADEIESKIKDIEEIDDFITHIEPFSAAYAKIAIPVEEDKISEKFGRAKNFLIAEIKDGKIEKRYFIKNKYRDKKVRAGLVAAKHLEKIGIDAVIVKDMGEIAFYALKDKNMSIYFGDGSIDEILRKYIDGLLPLFKKPKKVE